MMPKGFRHSNESKLKMSEIAKVRFSDQRNHPNFGRHLTAKTRKNISESLLGHIVSEETKQKISEIERGRKQSESLVRKRKLALIGHPVTKQTREKLSRAIYSYFELEGSHRKASLAKGGTGTVGETRYLKRGFLKIDFFINRKFKGSNLHHMGRIDGLGMTGIYIPKSLHDSIKHSLTQNKNLEMMNRFALEWYIGQVWRKL